MKKLCFLFIFSSLFLFSCSTETGQTNEDPESSGQGQSERSAQNCQQPKNDKLPESVTFVSEKNGKYSYTSEMPQKDILDFYKGQSWTLSFNKLAQNHKRIIYGINTEDYEINVIREIKDNSVRIYYQCRDVQA